MFLKRFIVFLLVFSYSIVIAHDIIPHHCHPDQGIVRHDDCLASDECNLKGTHCANPLCEVLPDHDFSEYYQKATGKVKPTTQIIALIEKILQIEPIYTIPIEEFDLSKLSFLLPERQFYTQHHRRGPPSFIA